MAGSSTVSPDSAQPVFYYDLGSPQCYIVAETIMSTLPVVPEWEPVLGAEIAPPSRVSTAANPEPDHAKIRAEIERQADDLGLQPLRWPASWPADTERAMLAATYAKQIGRAVAFSLAAFRQVFAAGRDIGDENTILIAGAACEMHPTAMRKGIGLRSTHQALASANRRAHAAGVRTLPSIQVGASVYDTLADAARALTGAIR